MEPYHPGKDAYYSLLVALCANDKNDWGSADFLQEARRFLNVTEDDGEALLAQAEEDSVVLALRQGEVPLSTRSQHLVSHGSQRLAAVPSLQQYAPPMHQDMGAGRGAGKGGRGSRIAPSMPGMVMPQLAAMGAGDMYNETPFAQQAQTLLQQKMKKAKKGPEGQPPHLQPPVQIPPVQGGALQGMALMHQKVKRFLPDESPQWREGIIISYDPLTGQHELQYGHPYNYNEYLNVADALAGGTLDIASPGMGPGGSARQPQHQAKQQQQQQQQMHKAGQPGGAARMAPQPFAPAPGPKGSKAAPPAPAPRAVAPKAAPVAASSGGSHSASLPPFKDAYLKSMLHKGKVDDLFELLASIDSREAQMVSEGMSMMEDAREVDEMFNNAQRLCQREQQIRAELASLGMAV